jgi:hypothetical protein
VKIKIDGQRRMQQNLIMINKSYIDIETIDQYIIREFNENNTIFITNG